MSTFMVTCNIVMAQSANKAPLLHLELPCCSLFMDCEPLGSTNMPVFFPCQQPLNQLPTSQISLIYLISYSLNKPVLCIIYAVHIKSNPTLHSTRLSIMLCPTTTQHKLDNQQRHAEHSSCTYSHSQQDPIESISA